MPYLVELSVTCQNDQGEDSVQEVVIDFGTQERHDEEEGTRYDNLMEKVNSILPKGLYVDDCMEANQVLPSDYLGEVHLKL